MEPHGGASLPVETRGGRIVETRRSVGSFSQVFDAYQGVNFLLWIPVAWEILPKNVAFLIDVTSCPFTHERNTLRKHSRSEYFCEMNLLRQAAGIRIQV